MGTSGRQEAEHVDPPLCVDVDVERRLHVEVAVGPSDVAGDHRPDEGHVGVIVLWPEPSTVDAAVDGVQRRGCRRSVPRSPVSTVSSGLNVETSVEHGLGGDELEAGPRPHDGGRPGQERGVTLDGPQWPPTPAPSSEVDSPSNTTSSSGPPTSYTGRGISAGWPSLNATVQSARFDHDLCVWVGRRIERPRSPTPAGS